MIHAIKMKKISYISRVYVVRLYIPYFERKLIKLSLIKYFISNSVYNTRKYTAYIVFIKLTIYVTKKGIPFRFLHVVSSHAQRHKTPGASKTFRRPHLHSIPHYPLRLHLIMCCPVPMAFPDNLHQNLRNRLRESRYRHPNSLVPNLEF